MAVFCLTLFISCQKQAADLPHTNPAASAGILWQGKTQENFISQITSKEKTTNDSGYVYRSRSFDKAYTFSGADCTGEQVNLAGHVNYTTTDVYDKNGNELSFKTHLNIHGTGRTADGETFQVNEVSQENISLTGANAGGNFLTKERWQTAHHGGTILYNLAGKFNSLTYAYDLRIASITYLCE